MRTFNHMLVQSLRPEEVIGLSIITLTVIFASLCNLNIYINDLTESGSLLLNTVRIMTSALFVFFLFKALVNPPQNRYFQIFRDFAPFLFILVIYFNIQDTILLIHPQDIHQDLVDLDALLFGIQPTVWMEQFFHPRLTDWFSLSYLNYYVTTLILLALLYMRGETENFRVVMVTMMVCYYIGFIAYMIFPAASPYLVIPEQYEVDIWKDTSFISWAVYSIVDMAPPRARDAFPSLHNAIVLLTMILAWRYHRKFFWYSLPLAVSIPLATVYLRYHFVVDVIAAIPVVALALYLSPLLEQKWNGFRSAIPAHNDLTTNGAKH